MASGLLRTGPLGGLPGGLLGVLSVSAPACGTGHVFFPTRGWTGHGPESRALC